MVSQAYIYINLIMKFRKLQINLVYRKTGTRDPSVTLVGPYRDPRKTGKPEP